VAVFERFARGGAFPFPCHVFPKRRKEPFAPELSDNSEKALLIPQIASAILALAFSAFMLVTGHSFVQRQAEKHDLMHLQNLMHLPAMR
jgi:hypothetical protein